MTEWLRKIIPHLTESIQNEEGYVAYPRRVYSTPNLFVVGSPIKRKLDTGIERVDGSSQHDPPLWDRIPVVGELKSQVEENNQRPVFQGLAQYAREVFRTQDRRFVLGFTLCGPVLRGMMKGCRRRGRQRVSSTQPASSMSREKTTSNQSQAGGKPRKRASSSLPPSPPGKRSRTSHSESRTDPAQHNRIHRRVVTSSPSKPLNEATSPLAIVNAFVGAISGKYS